MLPLTKKIVNDHQKYKLSVNQTISSATMLHARNDDEIFTVVRNKMVKDLANHIMPKLELDSIKDPVFDDRVIRGQLYILSKTEFEEMVDNIIQETIKELEPRFKWGGE